MLASFLHYPQYAREIQGRRDVAPLRTVNYALDPIFFSPLPRGVPAGNRTPSRTRLVRVKKKSEFPFLLIFFSPRKVSFFKTRSLLPISSLLPSVYVELTSFYGGEFFERPVPWDLLWDQVDFFPDQPVFNLPVSIFENSIDFCQS